jgi:hypothetical protein
MNEETYKGLRPKAPAQFGQLTAKDAVPIMPDPRPTMESMCSNLHKQAAELHEALEVLNKSLSPILWQDPQVLGPREEIAALKSYPCIALDNLAQLEHKLAMLNYRVHDINSSLAL